MTDCPWCPPGCRSCVGDREHAAAAGGEVARKFNVSVILTQPPHPYSSNPRLDVIAQTTDEVYDIVARRYPSGVVMGIWDKGPIATATTRALAADTVLAEARRLADEHHVASTEHGRIMALGERLAAAVLRKMRDEARDA
jgi:hypothetical protein